jgi:hypothetical protein
MDVVVVADARDASATPRYVRVWDFVAARARAARDDARDRGTTRAGRGDAGETRAKTGDVARAASDAAKAEFETATRGGGGRGRDDGGMSTTRAATRASERGEDARGRRDGGEGAARARVAREEVGRVTRGDARERERRR